MIERYTRAADQGRLARNAMVRTARLGHTSIKTTEMYLDYLTPEEIQIAKFGAAA